MYDFDCQVNRKNTNSLKWDVAENELPMWVADMDFETAPEIKKAIEERATHGVFGYTIIPDAWYEGYIEWWKKRHHFPIEKEWLMFSTGIVPAISSIIRKLTTPAEKVLLFTPGYNVFFSSIENNGRQVLQSPLKYDKTLYQIDFTDLEEKLADPQTTLMILCNPHNPIGKIWELETLKQIGELCSKYHVTVLADEIHCDLTDPGCSYIPFASVSDICRENSITCIAPTKTFNLAGLQTAAVMIPNDNLRHKVWRGLNTDEVAEPNTFAVDAAVAAFSQGEPWLEELRRYLYQNKKQVEVFVKKEIPQIKVVPSQATYLLWLDTSGLPLNALEFGRFLREHTGLYLSQGSQFGGNGENFLRMNIACPSAVITEGLIRLKKGINDYETWSDVLC